MKKLLALVVVCFMCSSVGAGLSAGENSAGWPDMTKETNTSLASYDKSKDGPMSVLPPKRPPRPPQKSSK